MPANSAHVDPFVAHRYHSIAHPLHPSVTATPLVHEGVPPPPQTTLSSFPPPSDAAAATSYKQLKEAWIADRSGGSIHRINLLTLTMITTYALWAVLRASSLRFVRQADQRPASSTSAPLRLILRTTLALSDWQLEFALLVFPIIAAHTILAHRLLLLNAVVASLAAYINIETSQRPLFGSSNGIINSKGKGNADTTPSTRKRHWSKRVSDDEDDLDGLDTDLAVLERYRDDSTADFEPPIRVSIDSAADAAHAAAAPPVPYSGPSDDADSELAFYQSSPLSPLLGTSASSSGDFRRSSEDAQASLRGSLADVRQTIGRAMRADLALSTSYASTSAPGTRVSSPLLGSRGGPGSSDHRSSLSSSPLSPLARSVIDPLDGIRRTANAATTATTSAPTADSTNASLFVREQPFLTVYRSHMMLVTVICILAVDFPAFPREFAKCESWGTSLMDLGVGSFVFSLGIVSALPFLRSPKTRFAPLRGQLLCDLKRTLPLIALGMVRIVMVKGVEYPEHVTEYGVHWNFFFTLALLPFSATLSRPLSRMVRNTHIGLTLTVLHQLLLKLTSLESWALSSTTPRDTLLRQNKEGLASLPGYLAIFLLGLDLGHYVLPLDPYFAHRKLNKRRMKAKPGKLAMVLASLGVLWWSGYGAASLVGLETSRRLANLSYVLWVTAFNTTLLLAYVLVYIFLLKPVEPKTQRIQQANGVRSTHAATASDITPRLLSDLNRHSLIVFLAANLLTGLVNVSMETMYTADWKAVLVLTGYTALSCGVASLLSRLGWKLKL